MTWLAHRTVSGGAPDCPVRHATAAFQRPLFGGWGYKYPNHPTFNGIQVFHLQPITRAIAFNSRHNQRDQILSHCTPGSSPYAYKRKDQGPLREGWPRGDEDETGARLKPLAPSPAWTLVTPYCKHTRPARGANRKAVGFLPLSRRSPTASLSPLHARPRARPIWAGARGDIHSSAQGPPGLETPTIIHHQKL
jgi:hypothetical protein